MDLKDVGLTEFPVQFLVGFAKQGTVNFKQRVGLNAFINVHWALRLAAQIGYTVLDEFQTQVN